MKHPVCVRPGVDPSPLFFLHDDESDRCYVRDVVLHVDSELAIYGVSPGSASEAPLTTLEGMATRMTRVIREIQPVGPYRLAGLSAAGMLAYEIGTQLLGDDQQLEFLGLIETRHHDNTVRPHARHSALAAAAARYYPCPITAPVHLFVSGTVATDEHDLGWSNTVPDGLLRLITVPYEQSAPQPDRYAKCLALAISNAIRPAAGNVRTLPGTYLRLVPLQSRPHHAVSLICIPGAGADVTSFIHVVSCLGETWSVYGLQPRGLDGVLVPHATVEAAALSYLQAIDEVYARGPVHLVGHSFGGWVAFEMVCLLRDAGRRVTGVTLLDAECPDASNEVTREYSNLDCLQEWIEGIEQHLGRSLDVHRADLACRTPPQQRELLHRQLVKSGMLPPQSSASVLQGRLRTFAASLRTHYCPGRRYGGPVTLVVADDPNLDADGNRQRQDEAVDGWRRWAPNLRHIKTPGNHITMLSQPHVQFLTEVIRQDMS
jgi:thioesterase domain-containing protein